MGNSESSGPGGEEAAVVTEAPLFSPYPNAPRRFPDGEDAPVVPAKEEPKPDAPDYDVQNGVVLKVKDD